MGLLRVRALAAPAEVFLKRLLTAGSGDIYQICRVFRDDELGRWLDAYVDREVTATAG